MPKYVESNIRNVGHSPKDLDEIAGNIQEKNPCSLPGCQQGKVTPQQKVGRCECVYLAKVKDFCRF